MYNKRIAIQGLMGFNDIDLDLSTLQGNIIAVVGENGAGKSTLLESMGYAGLYRTFPSREQGIHKYVGGSDAYIENDFTCDGKEYRTKILINPAGTRVEAYLFENGVAINDGKTSSFDNEIVKRFGSPELILSSVFSAQNNVGSFLELPRPKRKDLFISMLNLGILQDVANYSANMEAQFEAQERDLAIKIQTLAPACSVIIPDKESLSKKQESLAACLLDRETERDSLKAKLAEVNNVLLDQVKKQTVVNKLTLEIDSLTSKRAAIRSNLDKARKELDNNIAPTDEEVAKLQAEADMVGVYEQRKEDKEAELATAERIVAENKLAISKASSEESSIKQNISLRQEMLSKCIKDSEKLKEVPCGGEGEFSLCPLIKNSVDNKNLLPSMESHLVELSQRLLDAQVYTKTLAPVDNSSSHLKLDILDLKQRIEVARKARMDISIYKSKKNDSTILKQRIDDLSTQLLELIENIQGKEEEREDLLKQLSCAMDEEYTTLTKNVVSIDNDIAYYKSAQHQVMMDLGKVDAIKKNVESAQSETRKIEKELEHLRKEKGEWSHISYAFGPKAIQALEIDSAGPWVSDLVNDLLRSCFGTRFTINLITQAMKANKSGMKDFFDIEVIDAEKSRTGLINDLSGGEKVICSEAISLAIALYNGNVGGVKWDTLYRDECSGALSPKNALLYIKMLRRAIELGKFKRCFFIAHQPELVDASDNQIIIKKGKIELK